MQGMDTLLLQGEKTRWRSTTSQPHHGTVHWSGGGAEAGIFSIINNDLKELSTCGGNEIAPETLLIFVLLLICFYKYENMKIAQLFLCRRLTLWSEFTSIVTC